MKGVGGLRGGAKVGQLGEKLQLGQGGALLEIGGGQLFQLRLVFLQVGHNGAQARQGPRSHRPVVSGELQQGYLGGVRSVEPQHQVGEDLSVHPVLVGQVVLKDTGNAPDHLFPVQSVH